MSAGPALTRCVLLVIAIVASSNAAAARPPLKQRVVERLAAVDAEITRLERAGRAGQAASLAARAKAVRAMLDGTEPGLDSTPELHVVGFYEGDFPDGPKKYGRAAVSLEYTGRPVVLALCAYSPVRWDLRVAEGVRVEKVILGGYGEQVLDSPPADVPLEAHTHQRINSPDYFYTFNRTESSDSGGDRVRAAEVLRKLTGLEITTLSGDYKYRGQPIVIGPRNEAWRLERVLAVLDPLYMEATARDRATRRSSLGSARFRALHWAVGGAPMQPVSSVADYTPAGPIESSLTPLPAGVTRVAVDPRGPSTYAIAGQRLALVDLAKNALVTFEIEGDYPELSWPCGLAFDTKRNRLVVTSLGGVGYMYAFAPDTGKWSLLGDMGNVDLQAFTFSPEDDCFYGFATAMGTQKPTLYRFTADGKGRKEIGLSAELPVDRMAVHFAPPQLVVMGKQLALITHGTGDQLVRGQAGPANCYTIDPETGTVGNAIEMRPTVAPVEHVKAEELAKLWDALCSAPTTGVDKAVQHLAAAGDAAVPAIASGLPNPKRPDAAEVERLIRNLDDADWKTRDDAARRLRLAAESDDLPLRSALAVQPSAEARKTLLSILRQSAAPHAATADDLDSRAADPDVRIRLRAVRVLAQIATPAAVDVLQHIASGPPGRTDTRAARLALGRI